MTHELAILFGQLLQTTSQRVASRFHRDTRRFAALHRELGQRGVWIAPSAFEVAFLSLAHTDHEIDAVIGAFDEALEVMKLGAAR